jgi:hypothetical protein
MCEFLEPEPRRLAINASREECHAKVKGAGCWRGGWGLGWRGVAVGPQGAGVLVDTHAGQDHVGVGEELPEGVVSAVGRRDCGEAGQKDDGGVGDDGSVVHRKLSKAQGNVFGEGFSFRVEAD